MALLANVFGVIGNIVSLIVFLSPLPTFYTIIKKKSTEDFEYAPYLVAHFSTLLLMYYAYLKTSDVIVLIAINFIGFVIETIYIILYIIYAPPSVKIHVSKMIALLIFVVYGSIILCTTGLIPRHSFRLKIVGWMCAIFSVAVFASPLTIMSVVIRTKSVEYMPFPLSCCLTMSAIVWLLYGVLIMDWFVAVPNIIGLILGISQMIIYFIYKKSRRDVITETTPTTTNNENETS